MSRLIADHLRRVNHAFLWFALGCLLAVLVMHTGARALGSWPSLLRVGSANPLFDQIDRELGPLPSLDPIGHDGQLYYLIARDPLAVSDAPAALVSFDSNGPRYRYRRILFPLLAGGFGQFGGQQTFLGMVVLLILSTGLTAVALADIGRRWKLPPRTVVVALLNPGTLVSLVLVTADALALALALAAIALLLRQHFWWAIAACSLAVLTKETFLLVPWALACWLWHERRAQLALAFAVVPLIPLVAWSGWLSVVLPPDAGVQRNLGLPLFGLVEAIPIWIAYEREPAELVLGAVACVMLARGVALTLKNRAHVLSWVAAPWIVLGCLATVQVWGKPNNAARALALLWPLAVLLLGMRSRAIAAHEQAVALQASATLIVKH